MGLDSESGGTSCEEYTESNFLNLNIPGQSQTHPCTFKDCHMTFSRPWRLQAHLRIHNGERPFKCTFEGCILQYTNNSHLRRHFKTAHTAAGALKKVFRCNFAKCMQEFSSSCNLKRHIEGKHNNVLQFSCCTCNKGFKKRHQLKEHMYNHTGIPTFTCHICNIGFVSSYQLRRHLSRHKTYTCSDPECEESFQTWSALRKHLSVTHKPKGFKCKECGKSFKLKHAFECHLNTHLAACERTYYVCPHKEDGCIKSYMYRRNLMQHINSFHNQISFDCALCEEQFSTKQKVADHISKVHRKTTRVPKAAKSKQPEVKMKRKDQGIPTRSMAAKLLGIGLPSKQEDYLIGSKDSVDLYQGKSGNANNVLIKSPVSSDCVSIRVSDDDTKPGCNKRTSFKPYVPKKPIEVSDTVSFCDEDLFESCKVKFIPKNHRESTEVEDQVFDFEDKVDVTENAIQTCPRLQTMEYQTTFSIGTSVLVQQEDLDDSIDEDLDNLPDRYDQLGKSKGESSENDSKLLPGNFSLTNACVGLTPIDLAETANVTMDIEELIRQRLH